MVMGGGAVARASRLLAKRVCHIGAWLLQTDPAKAVVTDGNVVAGNAHVSLRDVGRAWYLQPQNLPPDVDTGGLEVTAGYRAERDSGTFTYAAHAAVVAVDPETGHVEFLDYIVVEDGGTLVNPMIVDGQICGGTAQGIGTCLYEVMPFSPQGQPLAAMLMDYLLPSATEVPRIRMLHMETPPLYRVRDQGTGRRRRRWTAGCDRLCGERCAAALGRRGPRPSADARANSRGHQIRGSNARWLNPLQDVILVSSTSVHV